MTHKYVILFEIEWVGGWVGVGWVEGFWCIELRFAGQADPEKAKIAVTASFHPNTLAHQAKEIGHANAS